MITQTNSGLYGMTPAGLWRLKLPIEVKAMNDISLTLNYAMSLPPGRYVVESAIQDRKTGRISVSRTPVDVAPASTDGAR